MARKSKKTAKKNSKRNKGKLHGFANRLVGMARRFGVYGGVAALVLWLGAWVVLSGAAGRALAWSEQKALDLTVQAGFQVENIYLEGRENANPDIMLALLNVQKGDSIFSLNPSAAQDLIDRVDWVRDVRVERRWPDTIYIHIIERRPLVLWQKDKKLHLVDDQGEIILTGGMERFQDLMIVIGDDAPEHAPALMEIMRGDSAIGERVEVAQRINERRWNLLMKGGVEIFLPEENIAEAWQRLGAEQERSDILAKDLRSIDLREEGRIVVRTHPGQVQEYQAKHHKAAARADNI